MARTMVHLLVWSLFLCIADFANGIGVNWGSICSSNLPPRIVVQLIKDNGIDKVKLFDADPKNVLAFANTDIDVMVGTTNKDLKEFTDSYDKAKAWVKKNVEPFVKAGVDMKYVAVGNEAFLADYKGEFVDTLFPAIKNVQKALNEAGIGDKVKATTPINGDVYESASNLPSDGDFRPDVKDVMVEMAEWFDKNGSPFIVNIYPYINVYQSPDFPINFAFFDGGGTPVVDKGNKYDNMFDANYDTLVSALKKAGVPDLEIVIGEIGWPTDGNVFANNTMAKKFYDGFLKKIATKVGTPLRPKKEIDVYLFSLLDEDMKSILPGPFERHWGIFRSDGQPKYTIDLTGQGRKDFPIPAKGVEYLASNYCVLNADAKNESSVKANVDWACQYADCTALETGGSCSDLDDKMKASYVFNMYYQMNQQNPKACDFEGNAVVKTASQFSKSIPSSCIFPIQIKGNKKKADGDENGGTRRSNIDIVPRMGLLGLVMIFLVVLF